MESESPQTEKEGQEARSEGNVLRFPRDWFGPPEELVPLGSSALRPGPSLDSPKPPSRTPEPSAINQSGASMLDYAEDLPPRAEDFWGERAVAVHDALQAPEPSDSGAIGLSGRRDSGAAAPPERRIPAWKRQEWTRGIPARWRRRVTVRIQAFKLHGPRPRLIAFTVALLAAAACSVIAVEKQGAEHIAHRHLARAASSGSAFPLTVAALGLASVRALSEIAATASQPHSRHPARRKPPARRRLTPARRSPPRTHTVTVSSHSAAAPSEASATPSPTYSAPAPASSAPVASTTGSASDAGSTPPGSTSGSSAGASGDSGSSSAGGPSGMAPFGPGYPSPDG